MHLASERVLKEMRSEEASLWLVPANDSEDLSFLISQPSHVVGAVETPGTKGRHMIDMMPRVRAAPLAGARQGFERLKAAMALWSRWGRALAGRASARASTKLSVLVFIRRRPLPAFAIAHQVASSRCN